MERGVDARDRLTLERAIPYLLAVAAMLAFLPALQADFVWDDGENLVDNERYRGFSREHLAWMFGSFHLGHYHPLTWLSFAFDHALWGMEPFGYHLTNLVLHGCNAAVFYVLLRRLLGWIHGGAGRRRTWAAAGGALLFALHPLRVESVAWVTERRDLLSGLLLLLTVELYLRAHGPGRSPLARRGWRRRRAV